MCFSNVSSGSDLITPKNFNRFAIYVSKQKSSICSMIQCIIKCLFALVLFTHSLKIFSIRLYYALTNFCKTKKIEFDEINEHGTVLYEVSNMNVIKTIILNPILLILMY